MTNIERPIFGLPKVTHRTQVVGSYEFSAQVCTFPVYILFQINNTHRECAQICTHNVNVGHRTTAKALVFGYFRTTGRMKWYIVGMK